MGPLSDRFGRRPVVLASVGVFALGSLGCAMATDIRAFLTCRLMQAAITSVYPVSMATIRDTGGGARARADRLCGDGGCVRADARPDVRRRARPGVGLARELLAARRGGHRVVRLVCVRPRRNPCEPVVEPRAAASRVSGAAPRASFLGLRALHGVFDRRVLRVLAGAPLAAQAVFGIAPAEIGFYMGTITAGFVCGSFLAARYAPATHWPRRFCSDGRSRARAVDRPRAEVRWGDAGDRVVRAVRAGRHRQRLTNPGAHAGAVSVRPALAGSASGLAGAMTIAGGAALSSLTGAVLTAGNAGYAPLAMMLLSAAIAGGRLRAGVRCARRGAVNEDTRHRAWGLAPLPCRGRLADNRSIIGRRRTRRAPHLRRGKGDWTRMR